MWGGQRLGEEIWKGVDRERGGRGVWKGGRGVSLDPHQAERPTRRCQTITALRPENDLCQRCV